MVPVMKGRSNNRAQSRRQPMQPALLDAALEDPMVESIAADSQLLGLWGFLRLACGPLSLSEIAEATKLDAALAQRKLDVLTSYGVVEALPSRSRRRGITYRTRHGGLRVKFPRSGNKDTLRRIAAAMQSHVQKVIANGFLEPGTRDAWGWHADFTGIFNLKPDEVDELRRRLNRVVEFTNLLSEKYAARGQMPELCNYALTFRVEPLATPALPLAPLRFTLEGAEDTVDAAPGRKRSKSRLSAREKQVAMALLRGLTLAEVAQQLSITRNTAATMTKRIYAKLGVHRRAELVARLQEELGDPPPVDPGRSDGSSP